MTQFIQRQNERFPLQGIFETMVCNEYMKLHADVIRQVSFIESLNSFVSASECVIVKNAYLPSVIIVNLGIQESQTVFRMNSVSVFSNYENFTQFSLKLCSSRSFSRAQPVLFSMKLLQLWQQVRLSIKTLQENF